MAGSVFRVRQRLDCANTVPGIAVAAPTDLPRDERQNRLATAGGSRLRGPLHSNQACEGVALWRRCLRHRIPPLQFRQ